MTVLHPGELAHLRTAAVVLFTATATIRRKIRVDDNAGGFTESWVDQATYKCSFGSYPARSLERENTGRIQAFKYWQFRFPADADVRVTDRIILGPRSFEVTGGGLDSLAIDLQVLALEIL